MKTLPFNAAEPPPGTVLLWQGARGTAVQRHNSDGLWHTTTGQKKTWAELTEHAETRHQPLIVLYLPERS